ncbi:apyrase-like [Anoplophora glabripennis]|uniref:apyrase-like n=1 Tax=Anoplophora glabripennis TaxID=217634 RepID=UPI000C78B974|nr:apyrase-like [Anoplophora glabripennis]
MLKLQYIFLLLPLTYVLSCTTARSETRFNLSVIHVNDFHARFDETSDSGGVCKEKGKCIGGFSRLYRQIKDLLIERPDSILLNAGDNFQGTLWYTLGKWNVTQEFLNKLPFDATVLGNHEFDDNIEGLNSFMKTLKSPIVVSNMNDSLEPTIQGLYNKSTVIERGGKKIGIIGVIISSVDQIAATGNLNFYLESPSVNAEAERLVKEEGVFTNIVVSHAGYDVDQKIAANASEKISLVVGGHTHTFLYTGENPPGPEPVKGPYPTIVRSKTGKNVLVVQASCFCRYLGNITIFLDDLGEIIDYSGVPIFLGSNLLQDEQINKDLLPWKEMVDAMGGTVLGSSLVTLDMSKCRYAECTFGNLVADAMVYSWTDKAEEGSWTFASIAIVSSGSMRTNIIIGNITYNDLSTAIPYNNTFDVAEIQGKHIKELLEYNTLPYFDSSTDDKSLKLMQFAGKLTIIHCELYNSVCNLILFFLYKIYINLLRGSRNYICYITYNDLSTAIPYNNTFDVAEIQGKHIKELLEYNTLPYFDSSTDDKSLKLMQFAGVHVVMNLTRPEGERVESLKLRCQSCEIPVYENIELNKTYRIVINSYVANGGDNYPMLTENIKNLQVGQFSTDVLIDYIGHRSPVFQEEEGRIVILR